MSDLHRPSRRDLLIASAASALLPATAAAAVTPTADIPRVEFAFAAEVTLEPILEIGRTPFGIRRRIAITGGTLLGPALTGRVVPGGADWQLERADGYTVLEADYMVEAQDGALIHVYNRGLSNSRVPGKPTRYLRTVPRFEAPDGPHAWLNRFIFVGTIEPKMTPERSAVIIRVYKVL